MRLAKILSTLTSEPLFCSNEYRAALLEIFQQHATLGKDEYTLKRTGKAGSGANIDVDQMEIADGIAVIPVGGPMAVGLGEFEKGAGAVDIDDIIAELTDCEKNDEVESTILNFDCPGGTVQGTPELGNAIEACEKDVWAWTRGTLASSAYWAACSCKGIFAGPGATCIGNIGVSIVTSDLSRMAEMQGVKIKVFASAPIKGIGTPGTSLSAAQEMFLQARVMEMAEMFYAQVSSHREIADEEMQGQFYGAKAALEKGFIDDIMPDIESLKSFLK